MLPLIFVFSLVGAWRHPRLPLKQAGKVFHVRADRLGHRLMIGQGCRCTPAVLPAKQLIEGGRLGELFLVESEYAHPLRA